MWENMAAPSTDLKGNGFSQIRKILLLRFVYRWNCQGCFNTSNLVFSNMSNQKVLMSHMLYISEFISSYPPMWSTTLCRTTLS